jgi:death-on-curing family protein
MNVTFELPPAQAEKLRRTADRLGISPSEFARAAVTDLLVTRDDDFTGASLQALVERPAFVTSDSSESALAQPLATFGGAELHPTLVDKAAALGFSLVANHPFVDGNKRLGHAAMEVLLWLNGFEIHASTVTEQEELMLNVAGASSIASNWRVGSASTSPAVRLGPRIRTSIPDP